MAKAHETYKRFVDALVDISRVNVTAKRIRDYGHSERRNDTDTFPLGPQEALRKAFLLSLKKEQQSLVADLVEEAYVSAIHDVACFLEHQLSNGGMKVLWDGGEIPASPFESMHFDFVARREGDQWPDEVKS